MKKIVYKTNQENPQIRAYKQAVEKGMQNYHVVFRGNSWEVALAGEQNNKQIFRTQQEAIEHAQSAAQNHGTAVYIHGTDGRIVSSQEY
jgi:hypothetical protein